MSTELPAGLQIDKNVERELINHRSLLHPNIIRFKEVRFCGGLLDVLQKLRWTCCHLSLCHRCSSPPHTSVLSMEYAAGGELFDRIVKAGRFSEDEARYFFQQLISGVEYCHSEVRHQPQTIQAYSKQCNRDKALLQHASCLWKHRALARPTTCLIHLFHTAGRLSP